MIQKFKISKQSFLSSIFVFFTIVLVSSFLPWRSGFAYSYFFKDRTLPNIYVGTLLVGNQSAHDVEENLKKQRQYFPKNLELTLEESIDKYYLPVDNLISSVHYLDTVETVIHYGKNKDLITNISHHFKLLKEPKVFALNIEINDLFLEKAIASIAASVKQPIVPPSLTIKKVDTNKIVQLSKGNSGQKLNLDKTRDIVYDAILKQNFSKLSLPVEYQSQPVSQDQVDKIEKLANGLINKSLKLDYKGKIWSLTDEELINLLSIKDTFDDFKIATWMGELAKLIEVAPVNALFSFEGGKVSEFKPAVLGYSLNKNKTIQSIKDGILSLVEKQDSTLTIPLEVDYVKPAITTENVNSLGIKEVIGQGESWFGHSISGRVHNVALSASKLQGKLVAPGEVFSFVDTIGEISASTGYREAYVIQNGKTVLGDGGGVCQTSTTLFRAALNAGLEIVERHAHAYRVGYYEQNYEVGVDATIYTPSVDFKFRNDTANYILIQTFVDQVNLYMKFEIYGTNDGRKVELSKSRIWNQVPPPPTVYQDDPTLAPGVVKQVDWSAWGSDVAFDWKVTRDGQILHSETFTSKYKPWQAVFLRGV